MHPDDLSNSTLSEPACPPHSRFGIVPLGTRCFLRNQCSASKLQLGCSQWAINRKVSEHRQQMRQLRYDTDCCGAGGEGSDGAGRHVALAIFLTTFSGGRNASMCIPLVDALCDVQQRISACLTRLASRVLSACVKERLRWWRLKTLAVDSTAVHVSVSCIQMAACREP